MREHALRTEQVRVTPEIAEQWLETMTANRGLAKGNLENLSKAMVEGRWHQDGATIKFNKNGELIDGQHRLWAVINTEIPQTFVVVWGVDPNAMTTLDTGKPRSRGDVLKIHDPTLTDVNNVAATVTAVLRWAKGFRNNDLRDEYVSNDEVVMLYDERRDDLIEATRHGRRVQAALGGGSNMAYALCWWLFSQIDAEDAEFFWDRLCDGQGLEVGNPIYALRELLRRDLMSNNPRGKMRSHVIMALIIKAWNAYRQGESVQLLRFKIGGAHPEKFPEPI